MIRPDATTILSVTTNPNIYYIPPYQRSFDWGKEEAQELIDDLSSYMENEKESLYLGTIIFNEQDDGKIAVVDGQQRLTTIYLLLIACREAAKAAGNQALSSAIQQRLTSIDPNTGEATGNKLIPSRSIEALFNYMCNPNWDGNFPDIILDTRGNQIRLKRQCNKIKPIYSFFYEKLRDLNEDQLTQFNRSLNETQIIQIKIDSDEEAFAIFERTNARGLDLAASDLLKNYLFAQNIDGIEDIWDEIVKNAGSSLLRMLKYFHTSHRGIITKSRLYRSLRIFAEETGIEDFLQKLLSFSHFYKSIQKIDQESFREYFREKLGFQRIAGQDNWFKKIFLSVEALHLFKIRQAYPLIYSAFLSIKSGNANPGNGEARSLIRFMALLEHYHFINTAVCAHMGNEVEKLYGEFCNEFRTSENFNETLDILTRKLREKLASRDEFVSGFKNITYSKANIGLVAYIFDRHNNHNLPLADWKRLFNADMKLWMKDYNIEHFYPQTPENDPPLPDETVHNIGNLLVLSRQLNSALDNDMPQRKLERMGEGGDLREQVRGYNYLIRFVDQYHESDEWNETVINERALQLADESYNNVWEFP